LWWTWWWGAHHDHLNDGWIKRLDGQACGACRGTDKFGDAIGLCEVMCSVAGWGGHSHVENQ